MASTKLRALVARLIAWIVFRGPVVLTAGHVQVILDPRTGRLLPVMAGADDDPPADPPSDDPPGDDPPADDPPADDPPSDDPPSDDLDTWKRNARKHEREAKKLRKERDDLAKAQKDREDAAKTDQEKAVEAAREEGRTAALTEAQKERRSDRLEVAVTRLAAKGVEVKDGEETKTLKFADPEDALVFIERAIARGDLDENEVFDDEHRVKTDAVTDALADILTRKPRLAAGDNGGNNGGGGGRRVEGGSDAGKGKGGAKGIEEMTVAEHIARKQLPQR